VVRFVRFILLLFIIIPRKDLRVEKPKLEYCTNLFLKCQHKKKYEEKYEEGRPSLILSLIPHNFNAI